MTTSTCFSPALSTHTLRRLTIFHGNISIHFSIVFRYTLVLLYFLVYVFTKPFFTNDYTEKEYKHIVSSNIDIKRA